MNKKAQSKQEKLKEKKEKERQRQEILKQLQSNKLKAEEMDKLHSIREATSAKQNKKLKPDPTTQQLEIEVEQTGAELQEPLPPPKPPVVNIFQTPVYQSENPVKIAIHQSEKRLTEAERLEIEAKKLFPDLSFDTFGTKQKLRKESADISDALDDIFDLDPHLLINYDHLLDSDQKFEPLNIERPKHLQEQRQQLPILLQENEIIDSIRGNLITLVSGETGCGKSTQIPQFLYESGFTKHGAIAITQPRRLAAIALAQRVCEETGFTLGDQVSYQVKNQTSGFTEKTFMKFMTDGILINELQSNVMLPQYSVIIIDEAHERKVNIDILIGVLSRVVIARAKQSQFPPLRLVIMSATLRLDDFLANRQVFPRKLNLIKVQTRQFPVKTFFSKTTKEDYVEAAIEKCLKIHQNLPAGDILVFLTGQKEIQQCCKLLSDKLEHLELRKGVQEDEDDDEAGERRARYQNDESQFEEMPVEEQDIQEAVDKTEARDEAIPDESIFQKDDYLQLKNLTGNQTKTSEAFKSDQQLTEFVVLPLFSKLEMNSQKQIFTNNPTKRRMIIIATNVAETSITIPTIRYVVDAGKQKRKYVDQSIGLERHVIGWISQAAADQRSGRAGRTGPGYCYRLYSTAVYTQRCDKFDQPEIVETPLPQVLLQMKNIGIKDVTKFPFLTPPERPRLLATLTELVDLGALKRKQVEEFDNTKITELGKVLASVPLMPKYGKMLLESRQEGVFQYGLILVSVLSAEEVINRSSFEVERSEDGQNIFHQQSRQIRQHLVKYGSGECSSDLINIANIIGEFTKVVFNCENLNDLFVSFAQEHKLITKQLKEIYYNIVQMLEIFNTILVDKKEIQRVIGSLKGYQYPTVQEQRCLVELIVRTNGLRKVAKLQEKLEVETNARKVYYTTADHEEVHIHPMSVFSGKKRQPYLSFTQVVDFGGLESQKIYILNLTSVPDSSMLYEMDHRSAAEKKLAIEPSSEYYDESRDQVMCLGSAVVGGRWTLERLKVALPSDSLTFYSQFAKLLLKGSILKFFEVVREYYRYRVEDIKESNMQSYSQRIIKCLMLHEIRSKGDLVKQWGRQKSFFLDEYLGMVKAEYHDTVRSRWPPSN